MQGQQHCTKPMLFQGWYLNSMNAHRMPSQVSFLSLSGSVKVVLKGYQIQRALASAYALCPFSEYSPVFQKAINIVSKDLDGYSSISKGPDDYCMISKGKDKYCILSETCPDIRWKYIDKSKTRN
jgi:hypothetical protein